MPDPEEPKSLKELLFETVETFEELEVLAWFHDRGEGSLGRATLIAQQTVAPEEAADAGENSPSQEVTRLAASGSIAPAAWTKDRIITGGVWRVSNRRRSWRRRSCLPPPLLAAPAKGGRL